jgi:sugar phosphate isomerase/epimerase
MIEPSLTISLLPPNPKAPFILGPSLAEAITTAAELGYPAIELFPPNLAAVDFVELDRLLRRHQLRLSTIGTGGGWVTRQLTLIDPDPQIRRQARDYIAEVIERAAARGATAIIGSMQGRVGTRDRAECLSLLGEQLTDLAQVAATCGKSLFYEPLNRYETDLFNDLDSTTAFLANGLPSNLQILADFFHMNIEEADPAAALRRCRQRVGHVHFVDSNRQVPGYGHTDFAPLAAALTQIDYAGYLAIEAFPLPDPLTAARQALSAFHTLFPQK